MVWTRLKRAIRKATRDYKKRINKHLDKAGKFDKDSRISPTTGLIMELLKMMNHKQKS